MLTRKQYNTMNMKYEIQQNAKMGLRNGTFMVLPLIYDRVQIVNKVNQWTIKHRQGVITVHNDPQPSQYNGISPWGDMGLISPPVPYHCSLFIFNTFKHTLLPQLNKDS